MNWLSSLTGSFPATLIGWMQLTVVPPTILFLLGAYFWWRFIRKRSKKDEEPDRERESSKAASRDTFPNRLLLFLRDLGLVYLLIGIIVGTHLGFSKILGSNPEFARSWEVYIGGLAVFVLAGAFGMQIHEFKDLGDRLTKADEKLADTTEQLANTSKSLQQTTNALQTTSDLIGSGLKAQLLLNLGVATDENLETILKEINSIVGGDDRDTENVPSKIDYPLR